MFFAETLYGHYELAVFIKLVLAAVAGGLIGFERELHGRPAGLRTHLLVAVGACLMMVISEAFHLKYAGFDAQSALRIDPGRTAAQIVVGIGFLGAGVIIKEGITVRGLTTAASLWLVAGLGMAFGIGLFAPGVMATVMALISLILLKKLEPMINKDRYLNISVTADLRQEIQDELEQLFVARHLRITDVRSHIDLQHGEIVLEYILTQHRRRMGRELSQMIVALEGVRKIRFH